MNHLSNTTTFIRTIHDLNSENVQKLLVPIVYLVILLIVGVPGNLTVLIIYKHKYSKCVYKTIIWNLAVADLIFCTVGIPFNIARAVHFYTFRSEWTCKIVTTVLVFGLMYSTHLLLLLSLHRFRQICMPLRTQLTTKTVFRWIIGCVVIAFFLASPQFVLLKTEHITLDYNVTGITCPITPSNPSIFWKINNMGLFCLFVLYTIILFIMYIIMGRKLYLRQKRKVNVERDDVGNSRAIDFSRKMTKIAFTISIIFAASYLPLFFLRLLKNVNVLSEKGISHLGFSVLRVAERLYIVNHVANPFVYAVFDQRFRIQFKALTTFKWKVKTEDSSQTTTKDNVMSSGI